MDVKGTLITIIPIVNPKIKKLFLIEITLLLNPRVPHFPSKIPVNQHCKA
jgi:hypothetical protein